MNIYAIILIAAQAALAGLAACLARRSARHKITPGLIKNKIHTLVAQKRNADSNTVKEHSIIQTPPSFSYQERMRKVSDIVKKFFPSFDEDYWAKVKSEYAGKTAEQIKEDWFLKREIGKAKTRFLQEQIVAYYKKKKIRAKKKIQIIGKQDIYEVFINIERELKGFQLFIDKHELNVYKINFVAFDMSMHIIGSVCLINRTENGFEIYEWRDNIRLNDEEGNPITKNKFGIKGKNGFEDIDDTEYWHCCLKLNILKLLLEKNYGMRIVRMKVVNFAKCKMPYTEMQLPIMTQHIQTVENFLKN